MTVIWGHQYYFLLILHRTCHIYNQTCSFPCQVLSRSVAVVMQHYYAPEMDETARFFLMCDRFFDCLNV